jgi:hypothetical protein
MTKMIMLHSRITDNPAGDVDTQSTWINPEYIVRFSASNTNTGTRIVLDEAKAGWKCAYAQVINVIETPEEVLKLIHPENFAY